MDFFARARERIFAARVNFIFEQMRENGSVTGIAMCVLIHERAAAAQLRRIRDFRHGCFANGQSLAFPPTLN